MEKINDTYEECVNTIKNLYDYILSICHPIMIDKVIYARQEDLKQNEIDWGI